MYKFAFLLKTYIGDFQYVQRLISSFLKYNRDNIPLYIVVEQKDKDKLIRQNPVLERHHTIFVKTAEDVCEYLVKKNIGNFRGGVY